MSKAKEPRVGAWMDQYHRYGWVGSDGIEHYPLVSVTSGLSIIEKPALAIAAARRTAEYTFDNIAELAPLGRTEAINRARAVYAAEWRESAKFGTAVHDLIRAHTAGNGVEPEPDTDEAQFIAAWRAWCARYEPQFLASEAKVFNLAHGFAGLFDAVARIGGDLWLLDYKTGNAIYPETELQLAGYAAAEFIGLANDPRKYPIPPFERYGVVHIRPEQYEGGSPEGYRLVEYPVTKQSIELFLHTLPLRRWATERERERQQAKKEKAA